MEPSRPFGQTPPAHTNAQPHRARHNPPVPSPSSSSKRPLPNGPCNHRDLAFGALCGCNQFWDKGSEDVHHDSRDALSSSQRSTYCVCGHHACFHLPNQLPAEVPHYTPGGGAHLPPESRNDVQSQWSLPAQYNPQKATDGAARRNLTPFGDQPIPHGHLKASHTASHQRMSRVESALPDTMDMGEGQMTPSDLSLSGFPRIPSVCLLSHELRERRRTTDNGNRHNLGLSPRPVTGLGLSMLNPAPMDALAARPGSAASTVPDEMNRSPHGSYTSPGIPLNRAMPGHPARPNTSQGPLDRIRDFNRGMRDLQEGQHIVVDPSAHLYRPSSNPMNTFGSLTGLRPTLAALNMGGGDTIADTQPYNPEDFIQSATEVAPSITNTPDFAAADQAIQNSKKLVETIARLTSNAENTDALDTRSVTSNSVPTAPREFPNTPVQEQLQQAIRAASPQGLQKVLSYLTPLHNLLSSMPNVANTMQELSQRMDYLENHSFNAVQLEDVQHQWEMYDGRLIEIEQRMDEHDRVHQAIDADQSSNSNTKRRILGVNESFGSNHSAQSTTSSALILAAMDRKEIHTELGEIKDRLDVLEAAAMPSMVNSWEIEVVLLPWGDELRGLWFPSAEPMHDLSKTVTQNSEEWTQARAVAGHQGVRSSLSHGSHEKSAPSSTSFSDGESGWSSQAISDWAANSSDEWMFAKACSSNNLAFKRLQSRGFVRNVTLTSASSKDIQTSLASAFHGVIEYLEYDGQDNVVVSAHPGLLASFIPLRKVFKQQKLSYLTSAEMATSALWSAQFLSSGVMMRVSGGKRRLYVTQREAYMQQSDYEGFAWTWNQIRQLPRFSPGMDSQMEGNDEQCQPPIDEANAKEPCWGFYEAYDLPPTSTTSSFSSHHSIQSAPVQLSMRPSNKTWRRSITPTSILKTRTQQPISPLSEKHPIRPGHARARTVSTSVVDLAAPLGPSKRRLESSPTKHSSVPHLPALASRRPSSSISGQKRRRITQLSSSPYEIASQTPQPQALITNISEAQRARALPSPFYSSHPELPRTSSDLTTRSQRSVAVTGKSTPFAYATPFSGPVTTGNRYNDFANEEGDTEPDDDDYQDDGSDVSWGGVDEDGHSGLPSSIDSSSDVGEVVHRNEGDASFSGGEDSGFASSPIHGDSDEGGGDDTSAFGAQKNVDDDGDGDGDDEEEDVDVFERLLDVLQR